MNGNNSIEREPRDSLTMFCEVYISQKGRNRPINEWELADAFVKSFEIPPLVDVSGFDRFFAQTNIELRKANLPPDLLGVHMSVEGKRRIDLSERPEQRYFQVHTVLHEIREIIEKDFCRLEFGTTESEDDLERRANEFAFCGVICSQTDVFKFWFDNAHEMESSWRKWGALSLIGMGLLFVALYSFLGAFLPHVTVTASGMRFER
jgi:hypothetical protein